MHSQLSFLLSLLPKILADWCTDPCYSKKCPPYAQCVPLSRTFAVCVCPGKCSLVYDPTCGTDRKSYFNLCALQLAACQSNSTVRAAYKGTCGMMTSYVIDSFILPYFSWLMLIKGASPSFDHCFWNKPSTNCFVVSSEIWSLSAFSVWTDNAFVRLFVCFALFCLRCS